MNRTDHLLWNVAEECAEVAQRASKAARFGLTEIQPEQEFTNAERILHEYADLVAVINILIAEGHLTISNGDFNKRVDAKKTRFEKFLEISKKQGRLEE